MTQADRIKQAFDIALVTKDHDRYEPFMLSLMDDICIRSTMLLLKECWGKHLLEFGLMHDLDTVRSILQQFPLTEKDEESLLHIDSEECIFPLAELDVRSMALCLFGKIYDSALAFFKEPPHAYYVESAAFFRGKVQLLRLYHLNEEVQQIISTTSGFGNEERRWIMVDHWREIYIQKLEEYFEGQPESWRLASALDSPYFTQGFKNSIKTPSFEYLYEGPLIYISDAKLLQLDIHCPMVQMETARRNGAKETLIMMAHRWGFDF